MPLNRGAIDLIRNQLEQIALGNKVPLIVIGYLTETQHKAVREFRAQHGLSGGESPEIVYIGRHHYESRVKQGYTIEDMILQIEASTADTAEAFIRGAMTSLRSIVLRSDGYGKQVRDQAIFELTARKPRVELYSVIPKGDGR